MASDLHEHAHIQKQISPSLQLDPQLKETEANTDKRLLTTTYKKERGLKRSLSR